MLLKKLNEKWVKLTDFLDRPTWKNRLLFYISIFAIIFFAFIFIFSLFKLIFPDFSIINNSAYTQYNVTQLHDMGFFDNERYLLSALVQSLAATIALVITLSLVAVQLAAQSYSARVIDVYKRNPDMWILLCIYIVIIFYGLGLIKIIGLGVFSDYMEGAVFGAYFLGFFAFVCLVPYMWKTLKLLEPFTIIQLLAEDITKEKVLNHLKNGQKGDMNPVLPIIDIINSALMKNDDETVRNGILEIKGATVDIFERIHFEEIEEADISKFIIQHIERIGILAADNKNENSSVSVILALGDIKGKATELKLEKAIPEAVKALENMQIKVLEQRFENATEHIIKIHKDGGIKQLEFEKLNLPSAAEKVLSQICTETIKINMDLSASIGIEAFRDLGLKAIELENNLVSMWIIIDIENIGVKAATNENDFIAKTVVEALENIMMPLLDSNKGLLIERVLYALDNITLVAIDKKLKSTIDAIIKILEIVATEAIGDKYEDENVVTEILTKLEIITTKTIDKEFELVFTSIAIAIKNIGMKAAEQKLGTIVIKIEKILEDAGVKAAEQKLMQSEWAVIEVLRSIGVKTIENKLEEATKKYENGLKVLLQKTDDTQKMFIESAIEGAFQDFEKAKRK